MLHVLVVLNHFKYVSVFPYLMAQFNLIGALATFAKYFSNTAKLLKNDIKKIKFIYGDLL